MKLKIFAIFILAAVLLSLPVSAFSKYPDNYVYEEGKNRTSDDESGRINIPMTYTSVKIYSSVTSDKPGLLDPEDLFIDKKGTLYIADTGNNRVVILNNNGETKAIISEGKGLELSAPRGVFADKNGKVYIADTGNSRILEYSEDFKFLKEYVRPESELLNDLQSFDPTKIAVGSTGYIYMICGKEFMSIDTNNRFKGFVGATQLGFDFNQFLTRIFATKEQKKRLTRRMPPSYNNFYIDDNGMFLACSSADKDQIRMINSVGKNIYKQDFYGEMYKKDADSYPVPPIFIDISSDKNGIISALDSLSGKIYQYDSEGNIITVFAGIASNNGFFDKPSSIACDDDGNIYVLDMARGNIQKFEPTKFIKTIHEASRLYLDGQYEGALELWKEIVTINSDYPLARKRMGSIERKQKNYSESLDEYKMAEDWEGYSTAFGKLRKHFIQDNFVLVTVAAIAVISLVAVCILLLKKKADKVLLKIYSGRKRI